MRHPLGILLVPFALAACDDNGASASGLRDPGGSCPDATWTEGDPCVGSWTCDTGTAYGCREVMSSWSCIDDVLSGTPAVCRDGDADAVPDATGGDDTGDGADASENDAGVEPADADPPDDDTADAANANDTETDGEDGARTDDDTSDDAPDVEYVDDGGITTASGTRLVSSGHWVGPTWGPQRIVDTELGINCFWARREPDGWFCAPLAGAEPRYTDATCTTPVLGFHAAEAPCLNALDTGSLVVSSFGGSCTMATYRLGERVTSDVRYFRSEGQCLREAGDNYRMFVPEPVSSDLFVQGTTDTRPVGFSGLDIDVILGDDGSRFPNEFRWLDGTSCVFEPAAVVEGAPAYCFPWPRLLAVGGAWTDPSCSEQAFLGSSSDQTCSSLDTPDFMVEWTDAGSCREPSLHLAGEALTELFHSDTFGCSDATPVTDMAAYARGDEVGLSEVPAVNVVFEGDGRLTLITYGGTPGVPGTGVSRWYDDQFREVCSPFRFADGTTRCIRDRFVNRSDFADERCTIELVTFDEQLRCGALRPVYALPTLTWDEASCSPVVSEVHALLDHGGPRYIRTAGGDCVERTAPDGTSAFVRGPELAADAFVEMTPGILPRTR